MSAGLAVCLTQHKKSPVHAGQQVDMLYECYYCERMNYTKILRQGKV
ncbi:hypothetical protein FORC82_2778 [Escherichia coli]|nr:hypothetical protein FORC82_2778 [Escherichia coli]